MPWAFSSLKSLVLWHTPVIPALQKVRQEDQEWKTNLTYIVRHCQNKTEEGAGKMNALVALVEDSHSVP